MKLITRNTDYALRAVCFIAQNQDRAVSVSELVGKLKIPRSFLRKLLQVLNKRKVLRSSKGRGGGFLLARKPDKVFLTDLMSIFQGRLVLNECFFKKLSCPNKKTCALRKKIEAIEKNVMAELRAITVASLLKE